MNKIVADASCIVVWNFPDEYSKSSQALASLVNEDSDIIISDLTYYEVGNALNVGIKRGRTTNDEAIVFMKRLMSLNFKVLAAANYVDILDLCKKHNLTFYDASYLNLAIQQQAILATNDTQLIDAAQRENVAILA